MGVAELDVAHRLASAVDDVIKTRIHSNQAVAIDVDQVVVLHRNEHLA